MADIPPSDPRVRATPHPGVYYVRNAESGQQETWTVGARYRLTRVLGCGSFGAVCEAADVLARRFVALKRVPDALATLDAAKRVLREVVVLNRLDHPNVIKMHDVFRAPAAGGAKTMDPDTMTLVPVSIDLYMAFEIAEGGDLYELRGEMRAQDVRSLMRQLASAVKYLHDAGVWHRDIKSANALCGRDRLGGRVVKLCDFGLARGARVSDSRDEDGDREALEAAAEEEAREARRRRKKRRGGGGGFGGERDPSASGDGDSEDAFGGGPRVSSFARREMLTSVVATPCYRAPEVIMSDGKYSGSMDVWALGCIFGELLQRQRQHALTPNLVVSPLFRFDDDPIPRPGTGEMYTRWCADAADKTSGNDGKDAEMEERDDAHSARVKARLDLFFDVVGTPSWRDVEAVASERWRTYLRGIRGRPGSLTRQFEGCDEASRDLLLRMLAFDPDRRASPDEILAHEYFFAEKDAFSDAFSRAAGDDAAPSKSGGGGGNQNRLSATRFDSVDSVASRRFWDVSEPGGALAALELEFADVTRAADANRALDPQAATRAWRERFKTLFAKECERDEPLRTVDANGFDDERERLLGASSFAALSIADAEAADAGGGGGGGGGGFRPSSFGGAAEWDLADRRGEPGRLTEMFPLFFRRGQRPVAYDGGAEEDEAEDLGSNPGGAARLDRRRCDRVDVASRYLGGAPGTTGVYGQGGVGLGAKRDFGLLGEVRHAAPVPGGDAYAARLNADKSPSGATCHLSANRHGEWGEMDLPSAQKRGVRFGKEAGFGDAAEGAWGVTAVPPGMSKEEGEAYVSVSAQQGR